MDLINKYIEDEVAREVYLKPFFDNVANNGVIQNVKQGVEAITAMIAEDLGCNPVDINRISEENESKCGIKGAHNFNDYLEYFGKPTFLALKKKMNEAS